MAYRVLLLLLLMGIELRAENGDVLWSVDMGEPIFASPTLGRDGTIYLGSNASMLTAYRANDSEVIPLWSYTANDWIDATAALGEDGTIYVGTYDSTLVAIDPDTGQAKWETTLGESEGQFGVVQASPGITSAGLIVVSTSAGFVHGVLPSGEEEWFFEIGAETRSSPAIDRNDRIYFGADDGNVYCINDSGERQWTFSVDGAGAEESRIYSSPALDEAGNVYIGSGNGSLYALTAEGQLRWKFDTPEAVDVCPAIDSDNTVYFASRNGSVYAVDQTGTELWASFLGDIFFSSPVIDANGFVYVVYYAGSGLSKVVAFAPGGQEIWETEIEAVIDSSPVLTVDGHLLVGAFDGKLYALECGASLGYSQPWPRFRRDTRGRGRFIETPMPEIVGGPRSQAVRGGGAASFTVETQDNSDQAIWRRSGDVLEVGKQLTMNLSGVTLEEVSLYDVIVSNERGEVLSDHFFLSLFDFAEKTGSFIHPVNEAFNISSSTDLGTWSLIDEGVSRVAGPTSGVETSSFVLDLDSSAAFVRLNLEQ